jgi:predicted kinase
VLVAIGGLPGVGKTTLARALAGRLGAAHLRIDALEAALVRQGLVARQDDVGGHGYDLALAAADTCLAAGTGVVVDAVFPVALSRAPFTVLAARHGVPVRWLRLVCTDAGEHRRRVEERRADLAGHRVPDWAAVRSRRVDAWAEPHDVVDTSAGTGEALEQVAALLRRPGPSASWAPSSPA